MCKKYNNSIANLLLLIFSIILGIVFCEIFGRLIGLGDPILYSADPLIGYRLKRNQKVKRIKNSYITVDKEGFRVASLRDNNDQINKIIFIGDSVTYGGSYIDDSDLFSELFCKISPDNDYCLNGAINSWGTQNMGRFISNFEIYSNLKPRKIILVILPGDEYRNLRSLSDTPYWNNKPKKPRAINEILRFIILKKINPELESKEISHRESFNNNLEKINKIQKKIAWNELERQLINSKFPIDIVITPPKRWFIEKNKYLSEVKLYDNILKKISNLKTINKTCNLYYDLVKTYKSNFYVDGVHLSKEGHKEWAQRIYKCIN